MVYRYIVSTRPAKPCPCCLPSCRIVAHVKNDAPDGTNSWGEFKPLAARFCPACGRHLKEAKK